MVQKTGAMVYSDFVHAIFFPKPGRIAVGCLLALTAIMVAIRPARAGLPSPAITNIVQLRQMSSQGSKANYPIHLEGNVWWVNPAQKKLVLHDPSGTAELDLDFQSQPVQSGQRVRL